MAQVLPQSLWGVPTPGSRAVGGGNTALECSLWQPQRCLCTVKACWLELTSDYVFSGFRLNYRFLSARNLLNDSAHPRLLTGESNALVAIEYLVRHLMGWLFSQSPQQASSIHRALRSFSILAQSRASALSSGIPQSHSCLSLSFRLMPLYGGYPCGNYAVAQRPCFWQIRLQSPQKWWGKQKHPFLCALGFLGWLLASQTHTKAQASSEPCYAI